MKESDRLTTIARTLAALGAQVEEGTDQLTIRGLDQQGGLIGYQRAVAHRLYDGVKEEGGHGEGVRAVGGMARRQ